ncbi:MAG: hypothetical protein RIK87_12180 [Fuerstiella sp.]
MRKDLIDCSITRNRETAGLTESYQPHREMVMRLMRATVADLCGSAEGRCSSVVLLGAGNCLDVDLPALSSLFDRIHLVDVDRAAVSDAVAAVELSSDRIQIHAPVDIAEPLLSLTSRDFEPAENNRDHCIQVLQLLASENGVAEVPEADVVVSLCVYSQILDALQRLIPVGHPTFGHAVKSVRMGHLRRMLSMLRPGGVAVFVTDVVSSDTVPDLRTATSDSLPALVRRCVNDQNFFTGTNPAMILADLNMLSRLPSGPDTVHTIDPWLWRMGQRTYAVYAMRIQKKPPVIEESPAVSPD